METPSILRINGRRMGLFCSMKGKKILEQGRFKKGDSITVTIIPDDREILGAPKKSDPVNDLQ